MMTRSRLILLIFLGAAALLTFWKIPLASSQGVTVVATEISDSLPVADLDSPLWQQATAVEVPLSAQIVARPFLTETNIKSVTIRALYNNEQIAFRVEWADATEDSSTVRIQDFRDAVALQFPLAEGEPFYCMGQEGGDVNIWHWKADWQADLVARQDVDTAYPNMDVDFYPFADETAGKSAGVADYKDTNYVTALAAGNLLASVSLASPVEDLIAGGFGSLTSQPVEMQNVQGYGAWSEGTWRVVFIRELETSEGDDVRFVNGVVYPMAVAAWDGTNEERNGQKSTSQWISLHLGENAVAPVTAGAETSAAADTATAATTRSTSNINTLEALPYIFVPMILVFLLMLAFMGGVFLLSKLPGKK